MRFADKKNKVFPTGINTGFNLCFSHGGFTMKKAAPLQETALILTNKPEV